MRYRRNNVCLLTCFLPIRPPVQQWLETLNDELQRRGLQLVVLTAECEGPVPFPVMKVPLAMRHVATEFPAIEASCWSAQMVRMARRDQCWVGGPDSDLIRHLHGVHACNELLKRIVWAVEPALVLTWGSSLPHSVLLQDLCREAGIPNMVLERGLLPDTLMVDLLGHGALSDLNTTTLAKALFRQNSDDTLFRAAQAYCRGGRARTKYAQAARLTQDDFDRRYCRNGRPILAFFGQYDHGAGVYPLDTPQSAVESPWFGSNFECLRALAEYFRSTPHRLLCFKPHPLDTTDYSELEMANVRVVRDVHLADMLEYSDVYAFTLSTTQFEALLYEKPCVLLARSQLWSKGAAYEIDHVESVGAVIERAFNRDGFSAMAERQRAVISTVLKYYLVKTTPEGPGEISLADFADHLVSNSAPHESVRSATEVARVLADTITLRLPDHVPAVGADRTGVSNIGVANLTRDLRRELERRTVELEEATRLATERQRTIDELDGLARERQHTIEKLDQIATQRQFVIESLVKATRGSGGSAVAHLKQ